MKHRVAVLSCAVLVSALALGGRGAAAAPTSVDACLPLLACHHLTITIVGSGTVAIGSFTCTSSCRFDYSPLPATFTVTASPGAGFLFGGWSGDCSGTGACGLSTNADHGITATFFRPRLNVTTIGAGGTVTSSPAGINCGTTCSALFNAGTTVALTPSTTAGWTFAGWSGACTGTGGCSVAMNSNHSVTATFQPRLTVTKNGSGTVTSNPAGINCGTVCSAAFNAGVTVTLTATPASGWKFSGWSGACSGSAACAPVLTAPRAVTATFTLITFALKITKSGSGGGTVTSAPSGLNCGADCTGSFASGTTVTLTAAPAAGSFFGGWSGGCTGSGATCSVHVTAAIAVTATFVHPSLSVTATKIAARWRVSRLSGSLTITGNASNGAELIVTLTRRGKTVTLRGAVGDGNFTRAFPLPATLAPGPYRLQVGGSSHGVDLSAVTRPVVVPAPPEGVVGRAYATGAQNGRPTKVLPHRVKQIWAIFEFSAKPKPGLPVIVSWYVHGKRVGRGPAHRKLFVVATKVSRGQGLPSGQWTSRLEVGGKLVGVARVTVA